MSNPISPPLDTIVPPKEYPMLSLEECLRKIDDLLPKYQLRFQTRNASSTLYRLRVPEELGRVLAADVYARGPFPKLPTSIMDGFLVRPVGETHTSVKKMSGIPYRELRIISNITAGHGVATVAEHCDATYVTTGTLVENADLAVVKIEDCDVSGDTVRVPVTGVVAGLNLRSVGSDIKKDELIARRGTVLTPALLAALEGVSPTVELLPVVKIAIVSSGDELVKKEVPDTNGPMLQGLLCERFGNAVEVNRLPPLEDDYNIIRKVLLEVAATNDVVITTGAVSKGSKDYIKKILEKDGKVHFGEVCLKPGKPTTFATLRGTPFFGLPGNPASAYVTFFVFVEPFLRALLTADGKMENFQQFYATLAENMQQTDPVRPEYVRVTASVTPSGQIVASGITGGDTQRSSRLLSCVGVNALVKLPAGGELVHKGARVPCVLTGRAELGNGGEDEVDDDVKAEAFAFRRLVSWLQTRTDVQNIDLMNLAGFCRNCLSKWYAEGRGVDVDAAKERIYGMSYSQWKARYQTPASEEAKIKFAEVHEEKARTACGHATGPAIHHHPVTEILLGVVTCSDRAAQGEYTDEAGPLVARLCGRPEAPAHLALRNNVP
ncbi:Molybdopterin biosynthesis protein moeA, putative [Perkinsus marinus ATCC 50983]|uniref:Molybdopterin biosynthesis protein moeA, putative n=1 Tax=Perkinsus marinus (strain ATCC 50983 / TXsc) TaxID=423536 RepID=C5M120_PERM5|nr:Molybdopterin biosynthesis protein moeA, putative [Perkinsus marinus ATCC 50983]EEQ97250.1 Molybdopterin biosynthesis protein moeA, putative [Perkinsus marinus ATCC 50983]|eukprot:XP_002764533.1 Molybdopterin biosynthesis protein moeA, putative [Perkinsus marinus ATCC 50983]